MKSGDHVNIDSFPRGALQPIHNFVELPNEIVETLNTGTTEGERWLDYKLG